MTKEPLGDEVLKEEKAGASLKLEVLDLAASILREALELVIEGAEVEDLSLAERKAKELYRIALDVWAKLKEKRLMKIYEVHASS